jgi:hypothetical protein
MSLKQPTRAAPPSAQNLQLPVRPRGRPFQEGNGGRRLGSKNKTTLVAEALARGQAPELVLKAIELAKAGNIPMLKLFVQPLLPKERAVQIDLPLLDQANDAVDTLGAIIHAVGTGQITPNEASALSTLVAQYARAINVADLELRLDNLEKKLQEIVSILEQKLKTR